MRISILRVCFLWLLVFVVAETFRSFVSVVSKLAVTAFISLCFRAFWPKLLNFFRPFQNHVGLQPKNDRKQTGGC